MNITKQQIDDLNAVITINIDKSDYIEEVNKGLNHYRKNISIPGFRKGHVPISVVKKRFEKEIIFEQINNILGESLNNYIKDEKIDILFNPIPSPKNDINLSSDSFSFDFEIGLMPEFSVDLNIKDNPRYEIKLDEKLIDKQIDYLKKKYGEIFPKEQYTHGDELTGIFSSDFEKINRKAIISENIYNKKTSKKLEQLGNLRSLLSAMPFNNFIFNERREVADKFIGKKINDVITFSAKELFPKFSDLIEYFEISQDTQDTQEQDFNINFTISEINGYQPAEITKDIIDDLTDEKNEITNEEELRQRIRDNYNIESIAQSEQKFVDDTFDILIKNTKFDLPSEFIKKWLQYASEEPLTAEQVEKAYNNTEKHLRYQLIEEKIIKENNLKIEPENIKIFANVIAEVELRKSDKGNITQKQIDEKAKNMLSDKKEFKHLIKTMLYERMLDLFLEKSEPKVIEVTQDEFIEIYEKEKK